MRGDIRVIPWDTAMKSESYLKGVGLILGGATLWSLGGVGIKVCGFGPWQLASLRAAVAGIVVIALLPEARRGWSWRAALVGVAHAVTMIGFVVSTKMTTAANAIFLQCCYPVWVMLLSPFVLKERISRRDVIALAVFGVGLGMIFFAPEKATGLSPDIMTGNIVALASGVAFALTALGLRLLRRGGAQAALVCGNATCCVVCGVVAVAVALSGGDGLTWGAPRDWALVALLGSFQIGLAYVLFARGMGRVRAMEASLIGLIEPVLNPLWVFLVFRTERPGFWALLGGGVILGATAWQILSGARRARAS